MSKSILIIDTPENCIVCHAMYKSPESDNVFGCKATEVVGGCKRIDDLEEKPDWCPLQKIPDKKELGYVNYGKDMEAAGFNACIDEILKGHGQASGKMEYAEELLPCPFCGGEASICNNISPSYPHNR